MCVCVCVCVFAGVCVCVVCARKIEKYSEGVLVKYWMPGLFPGPIRVVGSFRVVFW
jgi:hypothetical protein